MGGTDDWATFDMTTKKMNDLCDLFACKNDAGANHMFDPQQVKGVLGECGGSGEGEGSRVIETGGVHARFFCVASGDKYVWVRFAKVQIESTGSLADAVEATAQMINAEEKIPFSTVQARRA